MSRIVRVVRRLLVAAGLCGLCACGSEPPPREAPTAVSVTRPAVSWQGSGNRTLEFVSESGRFYLMWETRGAAGTFTLTVHSGVSGRPLHAIADQRGAGTGRTLVEDDPRPFMFLVESSGLEWTVTANELVTVPGPPR